MVLLDYLDIRRYFTRRDEEKPQGSLTSEQEANLEKRLAYLQSLIAENNTLVTYL